jgi:hypothetical protein
MINRWFEWDNTKRQFTFKKTEQHIFGRHFPGAKRIGEMDRDGLLQVIATGYHDRDRLAGALCALVDGQPADESAINLARTILRNMSNERIQSSDRD